ncbi:MAG: sodium:alanine symporter family protein [Rikenellaceae bacterium]
MASFGDTILELSNFIWGVPMIIILMGAHLYFTIRLKFPQRHLFKAMKYYFTNDKSEGDISPFASLATALASCIGTGNIIGVAIAVSLGGPGAVFWCWMTGVLGMATRYAETLLAVEYRVKRSSGEMAGGAMYVLERGLNMKWLAVTFALLTIVASLGIGNTVQANAMATMLHSEFGLSTAISGGVLAVVVALVILYGVKGIAKVASFLVPFMALFYIIGSVTIIIMNSAVLGETISLIFSAAFSAESIGGGVVGGGVIMAMRYGIARGLFSNESGMGSTPIVAAAARSENPVKMALIASTGTFWDTVVICAITGIVLVSSVIIDPTIDYSSGALLTKQAFSRLPYGSLFLTITLVCFTFSTILGWSYYAEKAIEYLGNEGAIKYFRVVWVVVAFIGAITSLDLIWNIADIMNALMTIPNIISLILLVGVVSKITKEYLPKI